MSVSVFMREDYSNAPGRVQGENKAKCGSFASNPKRARSIPRLVPAKAGTALEAATRPKQDE